MKIIILSLALFMLAGCVAPLHKPGADDSEYMANDLDCKLKGAQYAASMGFGGNPFITSDFWKRCMRSKGWG